VKPDPGMGATGRKQHGLKALAESTRHGNWVQCRSRILVTFTFFVRDISQGSP